MKHIQPDVPVSHNGHGTPDTTSFTFAYNGQSISLFQDDCIRFLNRLDPGSVDVLVTDPAYAGMNNKLKLGHGRIVGKYADKGAINGRWFTEFDDTVDNYVSFLTACKRVLNPTTGHLYIMFDSFSLLSLGHLVRTLFNVKNIITWDKVNVGMGHYYRRRHEFIIFATSGNNRNLSNRCFPDVWRLKRIHNATYPTQKPVALFETMLAASAMPGYAVCDPFVGSGSSAIAAIAHNCHFIGSDIAQKSMSVASNRIRSFIDDGIDVLEPGTPPLEERPPHRPL